MLRRSIVDGSIHPSIHPSIIALSSLSSRTAARRNTLAYLLGLYHRRVIHAREEEEDPTAVAAVILIFGRV
jgi:hypothetical protein